MTPGTLLALVEDNSRQRELILNERRRALSRLTMNDLLLKQDVICALNGRPQVRFYHSNSSEQQVRQLLRDREQLLAREWLRLERAEEDILPLLTDYRSVVAEREIKLRALWREHRFSPDYITLFKELELSRATHKRLEAALPRLIEERDSKLPAYEADRFYSYLREYTHDIERYKGSWLHQKLVAWLKKKTNFTQNQRNELLLREMPRTVEADRDVQAQRIATLEQRKQAGWREALSPVTDDPSAFKRTLLAKQIIAAKSKANIVHQTLRPLLDLQDEALHKAASLIVDQAGSSDLGTFIQGLVPRAPAEAQLFNKHAQELQALSSALEDLRRSTRKAGEQYARARELQYALHGLRMRDFQCPARCDCACHTMTPTAGPCACLYSDERFEDYPPSLDIPQLISSYMKRNLEQHDLIDLFKNRSQPFDDAHTSTSAGIRHEPMP
ncbi:hypothetical protein [Pseudomonas sp. Irchel 3E13]|uniref:hypothetical protein n=1 Tax=Pseudomonas sp. Irchel 3E13 TaxID=2008975 RepID=UPI000BA2C109|nr:hypothetical protein [Pseudomonas sp. Irchel 3E13]